MSAPQAIPAEPALPLASNNTSPRFSPADVTVVFFLGGPGSGKGTQSDYIVRDFGFNHLSAGDLLRAEQERAGSQYGELIKDYIKEGKIVPMEVTIGLLSNAMADKLAEKGEKKGRFLIDGFPRKMDQAVFFEETVCPSALTLFLDCPEDVMLQRLLKRGETSGRSDDNVESIKKRFTTFIETSMPVVDYFDSQAKVVKISSVPPRDDVYEEVKKALQSRAIELS